MKQAKSFRLPGESLEAMQRPTGFTPQNPLQPVPDRPLSQVPQVPEKERIPNEGRGESQSETLSQVEQMKPVLQAVTTAIVDALGHTELRPVPLPPKTTAPMYSYHEAILAIDGGALELPVLTDRGWLLEIGPRAVPEAKLALGVE